MTMQRSFSWHRLQCWLSLVGVGCALSSQELLAQNLLDDVFTTSTTRLELKRYAQISDVSGATDDIISMTTRPGDNALYVSTQDGLIHRVAPSIGGVGTSKPWFNINSDVPVNLGSSVHGGLRAIAFHPDFDTAGASGYGKFYASIVGSSTDSPNFLGSSSGSTQSVVGEWTYDFSSSAVDAGSFRELFRVRNPQFDHPIKQLSFNPLSNPGDTDYGLLYVAHGDGSVFNTQNGDGQDTTDALGKILRVDPLDPDGLGPKRYSTPGNAFADDENPNTLAEIYSLGHRNPHHLTFANDGFGETHLIAVEIGQDNVDEVNVVVNGGNYGWSERTGTFTFDDAIGYAAGTGALPANDSLLNDYIYPAAQVDHDDPTGNRRIGIAGGYVGTNSGEATLQGRYLFGDFAAKGGGNESSGGQLWSVDFDALTSAKTFLDDGEAPSLLETIDDFDVHQLLFDHDNNPATAAQLHDDFVSLLAADGTGSVVSGRANFRFGTGAAGELYLSSKQNGAIYLVTNTLPSVIPGDADGDGDIDFVETDHDGISDYDLIRTNFFQDTPLSMNGDFTLDGRVDIHDFNIWKSAFLASGGTLESIPEPTAWLLLQISIVVLTVNARLRSRPCRGLDAIA